MGFTIRNMHLRVYHYCTSAFFEFFYCYTIRFRSMQDSPKGDLRKPHRRLTRDSQDVKCIFGYTITVPMHASRNRTVLVYDSVLCRIRRKVTFENRTGDSQEQRTYGFKSQWIFMHYCFSICFRKGDIGFSFAKCESCIDRYVQ